MIVLKKCFERVEMGSRSAWKAKDGIKKRLELLKMASRSAWSD